eukprot:CAMPEP_0184681014 /NCGR_PEP_ID=MMETSP0312-20130426/3957_1 /TAXON_ID=31354 /ORGANISM="Compsopogon coeruleus, Strain SAG 36.94" /LENGTH=1028 /DNA_ID=CAMNT_0027131553 /DNA_START=140 /DNA_END=3226 /DNA_ORIENTATION=+
MAVMLCLDPTARPDLRVRALEMCSHVSQSTDGWRFCMQKLVNGREDLDGVSSETTLRFEVQFWCLQVVVDAIVRSEVPGDREVIWRGLLSWICREVCEVESRWAGNGNSLASGRGLRKGPHVLPPTYIKNKAAEAITLLISKAYPDEIPAAFSKDVFGLLLLDGNRSAAGKDMYFRVMRSVDDLVTSREAPLRSSSKEGATRATAIRDAMRDDCVGTMIAHWARFLGSHEFVAETFDLIRRYIEWIDISLVVNEHFVPCIYEAIGYTVKNGSILESMRDNVSSGASALSAILAKRMDVSSKIDMMGSLQVHEVLSRLARQPPSPIDLASVRERDLGYISPFAEAASLVNRIASEALECLKLSHDSRAVSILEVALPVIMMYIENTDPDSDEGVSPESVRSITAYVNICKDYPSVVNSNVLRNVLSVLADDASTRLPRAAKDLDESRGSVRHGLLLLFQNIARIVPPLVLEFTKRFLAAELVANPSDPSRQELGLQFLMKLLEVCPENQEIQELIGVTLLDPPRGMDLEVSSVNTIQGYQMIQANIAYFQLASRSFRILMNDSRLLQAVLGVYFDHRGLSNPHSEEIRSNACHTLLKLVRSTRYVIATAYLENTVQALRLLLPRGPAAESHVDRTAALQLFEILGLILGCCSANPSCISHSSGIVGPVTEGILSASRNGKHNEALWFVAIAIVLSKGFGRITTSPGSTPTDSPLSTPPSIAEGIPLCVEVRLLWRACTEAVIEYYGVFGEVESECRTESLVFFHRMIDTLEDDVIPYLDSTLFQMTKIAVGPSELGEVILLADQLACKVHAKCFGLMNRIFLPLARRVFEFTTEGKTALSEEVREVAELRKRYFNFLFVLLSSDLSNVLVSEENRSFLADVVTTVCAGLNGHGFDSRLAAAIMKLCLQILTKLVQVLSSDATFEKVVSLIAEQAGVSCVSCLMSSPAFPSKDSFDTPLAISIFAEEVALQRLLAAICGNAFLDYLTNAMLPRLGLQPNSIAEYRAALIHGDAASFQRYFRSLVQAMRYP